MITSISFRRHAPVVARLGHIHPGKLVEPRGMELFSERSILIEAQLQKPEAYQRWRFSTALSTNHNAIDPIHATS